MTEIIIDIETLSTKNNACILSIGALKFNRKCIGTYTLYGLQNAKKTFYVRISKDSCDKLGLDVDEYTVAWWKKQSKEQQYEVFDNPDRIDIKDALKSLKDFCSDCNVFWSQGSFDYNILTEIYNILGIECPWKFWQIRDSRTLFDVCKIDLKKIDTEKQHNALYDCYRQYLGTYEAFKKINKVSSNPSDANI